MIFFFINILTGTKTEVEKSLGYFISNHCEPAAWISQKPLKIKAWNVPLGFSLQITNGSKFVTWNRDFKKIDNIL